MTRAGRSPFDGAFLFFRVVPFFSSALWRQVALRITGYGDFERAGRRYIDIYDALIQRAPAQLYDVSIRDDRWKEHCRAAYTFFYLSVSFLGIFASRVAAYDTGL